MTPSPPFIIEKVDENTENEKKSNLPTQQTPPYPERVH
jgi:hypothetical protein